MRLYLKLTVFVVLSVLLQRHFFDSGASRETWFTVRCAFAHWADDTAFRDALIEEGRVIFYGARPHDVYVNAAGGGAGG